MLPKIVTSNCPTRAALYKMPSSNCPTPTVLLQLSLDFEADPGLGHDVEAVVAEEDGAVHRPVAEYDDPRPF
jgi:hypothetical protein